LVDLNVTISAFISVVCILIKPLGFLILLFGGDFIRASRGVLRPEVKNTLSL
jgi:hypothetical protein